MRDANSRQLMQIFIEQLSDYALIGLDADGRVLTSNAGAQAILGHASDEIVGRHISEFYKTEDIATALEDAVTWGRNEVMGHVVSKHGVEFEVHSLLRPVCDLQNRLLGFGMLARDVDSSKRIAAKRPRAAANVTPLHGQAKILVVDDDDLVRAEIREKLTSFGYRVIEAANGPEAIELLADTPDIDLLFTDVVMPGGMNGREVAQEARSIRPNLKVLFTSGYAEDALVQAGKIEANSALVVKPYRMNDLTRKIHALVGTTS